MSPSCSSSSGTQSKSLRTPKPEINKTYNLKADGHISLSSGLGKIKYNLQHGLKTVFFIAHQSVIYSYMGKALLLIKLQFGGKRQLPAQFQNQLQEKKRAVKFLFLFSLPQIFCKALKAVLLLQWIS